MTGSATATCYLLRAGVNEGNRGSVVRLYLCISIRDESEPVSSQQCPYLRISRVFRVLGTRLLKGRVASVARSDFQAAPRPQRDGISGSAVLRAARWSGACACDDEVRIFVWLLIAFRARVPRCNQSDMYDLYQDYLHAPSVSDRWDRWDRMAVNGRAQGTTMCERRVTRECPLCQSIPPPPAPSATSPYISYLPFPHSPPSQSPAPPPPTGRNCISTPACHHARPCLPRTPGKTADCCMLDSTAGSHCTSALAHRSMHRGLRVAAKMGS